MKKKCCVGCDDKGNCAFVDCKCHYCEHPYIENNMVPDTCRDCGAILIDGTNEELQVKNTGSSCHYEVQEYKKELIEKLKRFGGFCVNCRERFEDIINQKEHERN